MDVDAALSEVPVNIMPLLDDTDFKSIEAAVAYNATGMALYWHFVNPAGAYTVTAVTPTTGGNYDWTDQGDAGIYTIEIPASGGASINNDTEGFGWFTGKATGVLPWRGPVIGFRRAALNDLMVEGGTASTNLEDFFDGTGYAGGTIKLASDATLNATQGSYAPAKAGDAMTLTAAYDAAKTAAPTGAAMTLTSAYDAAKTAAQAGNAMALVDDAITASKYDESTAFPIKSADTGATIIARPGDKMDIVDAPSSTGVLAIVDAFLTRAFGSVTYTGTTRCVLTALQKLRNKVANSAGTQTVYKENDSTASYTSTITTDAAADPVVSIDPDS